MLNCSTTWFVSSSSFPSCLLVHQTPNHTGSIPWLAIDVSAAQQWPTLELNPTIRWVPFFITKYAEWCFSDPWFSDRIGRMGLGVVLPILMRTGTSPSLSISWVGLAGWALELCCLSSCGLTPLRPCVVLGDMGLAGWALELRCLSLCGLTPLRPSLVSGCGWDHNGTPTSLLPS